MSDFLRILGGALLLLCALLVGREYSAYAGRRIAEHQGFIALISHSEGMIGRFLSSGDELWRGFDNEALERVGFLPLIKDGKDADSAFSTVKGRLSLGDEAKKKVEEFFKDFGSGYKDQEIARISALRAELETSLKSETAELEKNSRVLNALLVGGALGLIILLV